MSSFARVYFNSASATSSFSEIWLRRTMSSFARVYFRDSCFGGQCPPSQEFTSDILASADTVLLRKGLLQRFCFGGQCPPSQEFTSEILLRRTMSSFARVSSEILASADNVLLRKSLLQRFLLRRTMPSFARVYVRDSCFGGQCL